MSGRLWSYGGLAMYSLLCYLLLNHRLCCLWVNLPKFLLLRFLRF